MLALLLVVLAAPSIRPNVSTGRGVGAAYKRATSERAFFEFAMPDGVGMGTVCSCAAITGANGEVVTVTRSTAAMCMKGNWDTNIQPGDMVSCSADLPRVMPGRDGTGHLGVLGEPARTNIMLYSQDFTHATWEDYTDGTTVGSPVKGSADTDLSPTGATDAERVTFGATDGGNSSGLSQTLFTAATYATQIYARGNDTTASGTFDICVDKNGGGVTCTTCPFALGGYTRCINEDTQTANTGKYYIGNLTTLNGGVGRPLQTVTLWGAQAEQANYPTSYVATTSASASRTADVISAPVLSSANTYSVALTMWQINTAAAVTPIQWFLDANNTLRLFESTTSLMRQTVLIGGVSTNQDVAGTIALDQWHRFRGSYDEARVQSCLNSTCTSAAASLTIPAYTTLYIGGSSTTGSASVVKSICIDPNPGRCW